MPWSTPSVQPATPSGYSAILRSKLPDSANGGGPFTVRVVVDWEVIGATEAEWDALFQQVVDTMVDSGNFEFVAASKTGATQWTLSPTP